MKKELNFGLIGVSNTIDALEKYNGRSHLMMSDIKNLVFCPYNQDYIDLIIKDKIN